MGGDIYLFHFPQGALRRKRLFLKNIQPCTAELSVLQSFDQILCADNAATCHVDQKRPVLHLCKRIFVDHMVSFIRQRQGQHHKITLLQQRLDGITCIRTVFLADVIVFLDGEFIVSHNVHAERMKAVGQHPAIVAHANDSHGAAIQTAPSIHAVHTPCAIFLCTQQFFGVVAALHHKVNAVLCQHRCAAACCAGDRDLTGEHFGACAAVQPGMIAVDPFQGVLSQQTGVNISHQNRHIGILYFFFQFFFIEKIHVAELCIGKHPAQIMHILFVIPHRGNNFFDFWHTLSSPLP